MTEDIPLKTAAHEKYCLERAAGKSQKDAFLIAYPKYVKWKDTTIYNRASELEKRSDITGRIRQLKRKVSEALIISKADVLAGMSETFATCTNTIKQSARAGELNRDAVTGVTNLGRALLSELVEDDERDSKPYVCDFGLMIAEPFFAMHRAIARDRGGDFWTYGGRSSTKSSCISLEIVAGILQHADRSAFVMVKRKTDIREGVYEQMLWALRMHGVEDQFECTVSPLKITRKSTGQVIIFRGGDKTEKTKSVKAPSGTYFGYLWIEEADQFCGMAELRTIYQSITRDAGKDAVYFRFHSFNPPRSKKSWANEKIAQLQAEGVPVYKANFCDVPPEWIPEQTRLDAERLKREDPESFLHEYMGEAIGFSNEVFSRVEVRTIPAQERESLEYHYYGIDWGFSQDPFVWIKIAYDTSTRTLYILDEFVRCGMSNQESADVVSSRMNHTSKEDGRIVEDAEPYAVIWADSAEPKSIADFREMGLNAKACAKTGVHNVRNSIRWLQCRSKIVIDAACVNAAREFSTYSYEMTRDGEVTGALPDADNHTIDAVRYACTTLIQDRRLT